MKFRNPSYHPQPKRFPWCLFSSRHIPWFFFLLVTNVIFLDSPLLPAIYFFFPPRSTPPVLIKRDPMTFYQFKILLFIRIFSLNNVVLHCLAPLSPGSCAAPQVSPPRELSTAFPAFKVRVPEFPSPSHSYSSPRIVILPKKHK